MNTARLSLTASLFLLVSSLLSAAAPKVGDAFPDLGSFGLEGQVPDLKGKVVVVDFWASWCGPCRQSFPALQEVYTQFKDKNVVVIGVSLDESKDDMDKFLKRSKTEFPILRDAKGKLAEKLSVQSIPSSFVISPDGKIQAIHVGFGGEKTKKAYITDIEKALAKK
jgi:peroxiredoxin